MSNIFRRLCCYFRGDRWLLGTVLFLCLLSLLAVYSASSVLAYQKASGDTSHYLFRHALYLSGGLLVMMAVSNIKPRFISGFAEVMLIGSVLLLIATFVFGSSINGSSRWLSMGPVTFQPSEVAKVSLMIYVAKCLAKNEDNPSKAFRRIIIASGIVCGIILIENLSTSLVLAASVFVVMIIGRMPMGRIVAMLGIAGALVALVIYLAPLTKDFFPRAQTWRARVERYLGDDGAQSRQQTGLTQADQALMAVSTGGLAGRGPGNSYMKNFLPQAYSDFIFSTILEEYGLWGGILVVLAYFFVLARARFVSMRCQRPFHLYLIYGLAVLIVIQAVTNMAVGVGLIPVTGQTLPMVSMGGTSNFITGATFGIMLSVSQETERLNALKDAA